MSPNIDEILGLSEHKKSEEYLQFTTLLASMIDDFLKHKSYIVVRRKDFDPERWLRKHILHEELREMDRELTTRLLGTDKFVRVA